MADSHDSHTAELLQNFLEGELDRDWEHILFRQLADNEELRSELREHLHVNKLLMQDFDDLVPPAYLQQKVYSKVGLAESAGPAFMQTTSRKNPLSHKMVTTLGGYVLSVGLTALLMFLAMQPDDASSAGSDAVPIVVERNETTVGAALESFGFSMLRDAEQSRESLATTPDRSGNPDLYYESSAEASQPGRKAPPVPVSDAHNRQQIRQESIRSARYVSIAPSAFHGGHQSEATLTARRVVPSPSVAAAETTTHLLPDLQNTRWLFSLRGIMARSLREVEVEAPEAPVFHNMAAALYYQLSDSWLLGLEFGQENYAQRYRGSELNRTLTVLQDPLLFWAGAGAHLTLREAELLPGIAPYAHALVGATRIGPLLRGGLGLRYEPGTSLSISLGLEGSSLWYQHQASWFSSEKLGVTYGIGIRF